MNLGLLTHGGFGAHQGLARQALAPGLVAVWEAAAPVPRFVRVRLAGRAPLARLGRAG